MWRATCIGTSNAVNRYRVRPIIVWQTHSPPAAPRASPPIISMKRHGAMGEGDGELIWLHIKWTTVPQSCGTVAQFTRCMLFVCLCYHVRLPRTVLSVVHNMLLCCDCTLCVSVCVCVFLLVHVTVPVVLLLYNVFRLTRSTVCGCFILLCMCRFGWTIPMPWAIIRDSDSRGRAYVIVTTAGEQP